MNRLKGQVGILQILRALLLIMGFIFNENNWRVCACSACVCMYVEKRSRHRHLPEAWSLPELTEPAGLGSQSVSFTVTVGGATAAPGLKCALGTVVLVLGISQ